jgi:hypothetical protein
MLCTRVHADLLYPRLSSAAPPEMAFCSPSSDFGRPVYYDRGDAPSALVADKGSAAAHSPPWRVHYPHSLLNFDLFFCQSWWIALIGRGRNGRA